MTNQSLTDPLKSVTQTSMFRFFALAVLLGPLLMIGLVWLANCVLPAPDAAAFKEPLYTIWKYVASGSFLGIVANRTLVTWGKVATQKEAVGGTQVPTTADKSATPIDDLADFQMQGNNEEFN